MVSWRADWGRGGGVGQGVFFVCLFFLYICFIDKRARGKQRRPVYHKNTNGEKKEKNPSGLEQTANESDVWFTLLFTLFLVACPFSSQRSALSCLQSSSPQQGSPWSQLPAPLWPWATSAGRLGVCEGVWAGYSWSSNPVSSLRSVRAMLQSSQQLGDGVNQLDTLSSNYAYSHRHTHMKHIYLWHVSASSQASDWGGGVCLLPCQQQDGSIAASCEIDGLQAVCVAGLIEFAPQTPVVWTGACHSPHTHSHTHPPGPVSVSELTAALLLLLLISQQQKDIRLSFFSALSLFHSRFSLFIFFLALLQAPSDFLLTAARSDCRDI